MALLVVIEVVIGIMEMTVAMVMVVVVVVVTAQAMVMQCTQVSAMNQTQITLPESKRSKLLIWHSRQN